MTITSKRQVSPEIIRWYMRTYVIRFFISQIETWSSESRLYQCVWSVPYVVRNIWPCTHSLFGLSHDNQNSEWVQGQICPTIPYVVVYRFALICSEHYWSIYSIEQDLIGCYVPLCPPFLYVRNEFLSFHCVRMRTLWNAWYVPILFTVP